MVGILLRCDANPSSHGSGHPFSPLEAAFASRSASVIRLLVETGADLEAKGLFGTSALDLAARKTRDEPDVGGGRHSASPAAGGGLF
jgi:hypothetical protein